MRRPKRHQSKAQRRIKELIDCLRTCRGMFTQAMREGLVYKRKLDDAEKLIMQLQPRTPSDGH